MRDDLPGVTGPVVVVLITDGEETCDGDPAAAIQALRGAGFDVRVNIVGFAIDEHRLREEFEAWARAGNGRYVEANDGAQLAAHGGAGRRPHGRGRRGLNGRDHQVIPASRPERAIHGSLLHPFVRPTIRSVDRHRQDRGRRDPHQRRSGQWRARPRYGSRRHRQETGGSLATIEPDHSAMPVRYDIDADQRVIRTRCIGETTLREVLAHFAELKSTPSLPQPLDVRLDFTEMTSLPRLDQIEAAAETTASLTPMLKWGAMAIVVNDPLAHHVSRVYEALVNHYFQEVKIFRDAADADVWLETVRRNRRPDRSGAR